MASDIGNRSISDVLHDIVENLQHIVHFQLRLAREEITTEVAKAKIAGLLLATGAVSGLFAMLFALWAGFLALSRVLPDWAAALIVAGTMALGAVTLVAAGRTRLRKVHTLPELTVKTVKEDFQWAKQPIK
jgi:cytochrome c biogenesis protein CcdA